MALNWTLASLAHWRHWPLTQPNCGLCSLTGLHYDRQWVGVFYNGKGNNFRDDTELKITLEIEYCVLILEYIFKILGEFFFFVCIFYERCFSFHSILQGILASQKVGSHWFQSLCLMWGTNWNLRLVRDDMVRALDWNPGLLTQRAVLSFSLYPIWYLTICVVKSEMWVGFVIHRSPLGLLLQLLPRILNSLQKLTRFLGASMLFHSHKIHLVFRNLSAFKDCVST